MHYRRRTKAFFVIGLGLALGSLVFVAVIALAMALNEAPLRGPTMRWLISWAAAPLGIAGLLLGVDLAVMLWRAVPDYGRALVQLWHDVQDAWRDAA